MAPCGVLLMHLFFNFILFFKRESWGEGVLGHWFAAFFSTLVEFTFSPIYIKSN